MGNAAGVKKTRQQPVELVLSELGGVPGCKAYHSSVLLGGTEYFFDDQGIGAASGLLSHGECASRRVAVGSTVVDGTSLQERLAPHFKPGAYDLLRLNCNSFTDAALVVLVGKRLETKYRQLERAGAKYPQLVARLSGGSYSPNPRAEGFDLDKLCNDLRFGPAWASNGEALGADGDGEAASSSRTVPTAARKKGLKPLVRVRILPFQDAFEFNFDHMRRTYVLPHLQSPVVADPATGRGLRPGDEFSGREGRVRFRVVACEPAEGGLPNADTVVATEGDPIERTVLQSVTVLPLESTLPFMKGRSTEEWVRPFLIHHSSDLVAGQILEILGLRFRVIKTIPAAGGGACVDTELITTGPAVKVCAVDGCQAVPAKQCREKTCRRPVCLAHASEVVELSCLCPLHAPKTGLFGRQKKS